MKTRYDDLKKEIFILLDTYKGNFIYKEQFEGKLNAIIKKIDSDPIYERKAIQGLMQQMDKLDEEINVRNKKRTFRERLNEKLVNIGIKKK